MIARQSCESRCNRVPRVGTAATGQGRSLRVYMASEGLSRRCVVFYSRPDSGNLGCSRYVRGAPEDQHESTASDLKQLLAR